MPGFSNITGDESIMFADNASFNGTERGGKMTTNGQLWIGSTVSPHVRLGNITSSDTSVTITNGAGTIDLTVTAGPTVVTKLAPDTGTSPIVPSAGVITVIGGTVVAGTNPIRTNGTAASTMTIQVQRSQALAATDSTKIGLCNFDSARFTCDANGFVSTSGTGVGNTITGQSGGALSPTAGNWNINGGSVAAGTSPLVSSGSGSTLTLNVQRSQAIASADSTKVGVSNFNSANFTVDANGFVGLASTGPAMTITGDSGGALSTTANNWNILGLSGSKTSGSGSTLTIKSPPFSQVSGAGTSSLNTGEFVTAAVARTLPATAGLVDGDLVIYYATSSNVLTVTANTGQTIRLGSTVSASAGTAASTATGDSLTLRFDATAVSWRAVSVVGNWIVT